MTIEELKSLIDTYNELKKKSEDIAERYSGAYNFSADSIEYDADGQIEVQGTETCRGCTDYASYEFPMEWLLLPEDELERAIKEKKEQDRLDAERYKKKLAELQAQKTREKELQMLAELKAKYEGGVAEVD